MLLWPFESVLCTIGMQHTVIISTMTTKKLRDFFFETLVLRVNELGRLHASL